MVSACSFYLDGQWIFAHLVLSTRLHFPFSLEEIAKQKDAQTYDHYSYEYTRLEPFTKKQHHSDTGDTAYTLNTSVRVATKKNRKPFNENASAPRTLHISTRKLTASTALDSSVNSSSKRLMRRSQSVHIKGT